jgi:hypothetical protein
MRKRGAFLIEDDVYRTHETSLAPAALEGSAVDAPSGIITKAGAAVGVEIDGKAYVGFPTPSRKLEFFSKTLRDWKWPEYALPAYIRSHVHWSEFDRQKGSSSSCRRSGYRR